MKRFTAVTVILLVLLALRMLGQIDMVIRWMPDIWLRGAVWIPAIAALVHALAITLIILKRRSGSILAAILAASNTVFGVAGGVTGPAGTMAYVVLDLIILLLAYMEYRQVTQVAKATEEPPSPPI